MIAVMGIVISLGLLMILAYRNHSVLVIAPICALCAVAIDGQYPLLATYTQIFLDSLGKFVIRYFPLFMLGAIFGKLMEASGSAHVLAQATLRWLGKDRALLALVLTCAILTYGGVSLFVVVFTVFPLARELFRQADLPLRLIPGAIALGAFTFTMTALPGTVQIQNLIPMPFFKTNAFAAPGMGCLAASIMFAVGMLWLTFRERQARRHREGFFAHEEGPVLKTETSEAARPSAASMRLGSAEPERVSGVEPEVGQVEAMASARPGLVIALAPLVGLMLLNFMCSQYWIPSLQADYLADKKFGATELSKVQGTWSAILGMLGGLVLVIVLNVRRLPQLPQLMGAGAHSSLLPMFNAASEFGYGSTIAGLSGFAAIKGWIMSLAPSQPLIAEGLSVNVLAGITGSASGGLSIALEAMGQTFYEQAIAAHISTEVMHRVASLSCGGLDTLPHNGAVITLLLICGSTHKQSYLDIFVVSVLGPVLATIIVIGLNC